MPRGGGKKPKTYKTEVVSTSSKPISRENVGYRMLKKAGWNEGTGLGSHKQGTTTPYVAVATKGTRGIGFESKERPKKLLRNEKTVDTTLRGVHDGQHEHMTRQQAEAKRLKEKVLEGRIRSMLRENDYATTSDTNPLTRKRYQKAYPNPLMQEGSLDAS